MNENTNASATRESTHTHRFLTIGGSAPKAYTLVCAQEKTGAEKDILTCTQTHTNTHTHTHTHTHKDTQERAGGDEIERRRGRLFHVLVRKCRRGEGGDSCNDRCLSLTRADRNKRTRSSRPLSVPPSTIHHSPCSSLARCRLRSTQRRIQARWYKSQNECLYEKHSFLYSTHSSGLKMGNECAVLGRADAGRLSFMNTKSFFTKQHTAKPSYMTQSCRRH